MELKTHGDLAKAASDFLAKHTSIEKSNASEAKKVSDTSRETLYENLARGYELCLAMHDPSNATAVASFLISRLVAVPKAESRTNPFFQYVKAIWSEDKTPDAVTSDWVFNRSAGKYANVFRLAHSLNKSPAMFAHWLLTYEGGMAAAERADRAKHGFNDPDAEAVLQRQIKLIKSQHIGTLDLAHIELKDLKAQYVCVWGVLDKDEQFTAMGELPDMSSRVEQHLRRIAPKRAPVIEAGRKAAAAELARKAEAEGPAKHAQGQEQREVVTA